MSVGKVRGLYSAVRFLSISVMHYYLILSGRDVEFLSNKGRH